MRTVIGRQRGARVGAQRRPVGIDVIDDAHRQRRRREPPLERRADQHVVYAVVRQLAVRALDRDGIMYSEVQAFDER